MSTFLWRVWGVWWRLLVMLTAAFLLLAPGLAIAVWLDGHPVVMPVFLVGYVVLVIAVIIVVSERMSSWLKWIGE